MTVRRFTAQCLPPLRNKEIAQATATLRNFKPVDVADGSFAADQSRQRLPRKSASPPAHPIH